MEMGSKGWCECSLDNSGQFSIEQLWNGECAWWYAFGTWRNFNVDVGCLKRVKEGGFLLHSIAPLILPCYAEASQIFKLEFGVKEDILYETIDLSIRLGRYTGVLPVHKHFNWFISMDRGWRWQWHKHRVSSSNLVKIRVRNKWVGIKGGPVKVFSQQAKGICGSPKSIAHNQTQAR